MKWNIDNIGKPGETQGLGYAINDEALCKALEDFIAHIRAHTIYPQGVLLIVKSTNDDFQSRELTITFNEVETQ